MLLACLALGLLSCRDTLQPQQPTPPASVEQQEASGPVKVLELSCTLRFEDGQSGEISCGPAGAQGQPGVSRSVVLPVVSEYARWLPFNLVKDTVSETWSFISSVQNLLGQPIGTLDGTTAVGTKVAITYGPVATAGSGVVSVMNADGTGNFTGPDQPYFNYPWIIAPQEISPSRTWNFHVPNTVTEVTMGVAISTDFPAEQNVGLMPPDTVPLSIYDPANLISDAPQMAGEFPRNIVVLGFRKGATLAERQLAVAKVNGTVIGGSRYLGDDGVYDVRIEDDGTAGPLFAAIEQLKKLPQVELAVVFGVMHDARDYLKPADDSLLPDWSLSESSTGSLWAFERIAAPMTWGCSTGSADVIVGVVDYPFQDVDDLRPNVQYASLYSGGTDRHGTAVASIIGARGDNHVGIPGMMWNASLRLYDRRLAPSGASDTLKSWQRDIALMASAARAGARVINLSGSAFDTAQMYRQDTVAVNQVAASLARAIRRLNEDGKRALYVFAAGNEGGRNIDTYFNGYPAAVDSFPSQVIVVGALTKNGTQAAFSSGRVLNSVEIQAVTH